MNLEAVCEMMMKMTQQERDAVLWYVDVAKDGNPSSKALSAAFNSYREKKHRASLAESQP